MAAVRVLTASGPGRNGAAVTLNFITPVGARLLRGDSAFDCFPKQ